MLKYPEACKDFNAALAINQNDLGALINLSAASLNGKMYQQCISTSDRLQKLAPNRWESYFYKGTAYVNLGKYKEGLLVLEKAIELNPNDPFVWYNTGVAHQQMGNKEQAKKYILKAKSLNYPVSEAVLNSL